MMETQLIQIERNGPVAILRLNEPKALNPFSYEMRVQAADAYEALSADDTVGAIVLTGAGGNFSAGADIRQLKAIAEPDPDLARRRLEPLARLVRLVAGGPKPSVAAIEGVAFGAGMSLASACDHVVAGRGARFGAAFVRIGLTADCGLLSTLPQRVGITRARQIMMTGKPLSAEAAAEIGLVDTLVDDGASLETAIATAEGLTGGAPLAVASIRRALAQGPMTLEQALAFESATQPMLSMTADHREGIAAFFDKRKPVFRGK